MHWYFMKKTSENFLARQLKTRKLPWGNLITEIARFFLCAPYKSYTLEAPGKEKLIVNLKQFDCFTFVESVLALAHCFVVGRISPREFQGKLKFMRYRQGVIAGYASRLHYFTDWLFDNEKKKIVRDISKNLGGERQCKKINYMSTHRELYPVLKREKEFQEMLSVEKNLSRRGFYVIKKSKMNRRIKMIQNGDIIAFTAKQEGLDVAHVGFAFWRGRNLHLLHASSKEGNVVESEEAIKKYLKKNKKYTGVIVARSQYDLFFLKSSVFQV
jgi:N-acetylmuramoyl-L-alanine amidase-like